jgi:hypothetical protein
VKKVLGKEEGPDALLQTREPVEKFPDFVRYIVQRLQTAMPLLGKVKIAQILAPAGLHLRATTVGRIRKARSGAWAQAATQPHAVGIACQRQSAQSCLARRSHRRSHSAGCFSDACCGTLGPSKEENNGQT